MGTSAEDCSRKKLFEAKFQCGALKRAPLMIPVASM